MMAQNKLISSEKWAIKMLRLKEATKVQGE